MFWLKQNSIFRSLSRTSNLTLKVPVILSLLEIIQNILKIFHSNFSFLGNRKL